jgi:hypothetical protein
MALHGFILINTEGKCSNCPLQHGFTETQGNTDHPHGSTYHGKIMLHNMWALGMPLNSA